ncbi:MAG: hypothetical protein HC944_05255 [Nanoarchaeota archaeon]|nr:hypothetical protein [Nanoarchaeota archaeon]
MNIGGEKTAHSRVLASFNHLDQDDEADLTDGLKFDLVRRQRNVMVEKKNSFRELFFLQLHLLMHKKMNSV